MTFVCESGSLNRRVKKENRERKEQEVENRFFFYLWIPSQIILSKRKGKKKNPWLFGMLQRHNILVFLLQAETQLCKTVTGWFTVSHNRSWWLDYIPRHSRQAIYFFFFSFQAVEVTLAGIRALSHTQKQRVTEQEMAVTVSWVE